MVKYKCSPPKMHRYASGGAPCDADLSSNSFPEYLESHRKLMSFLRNPDELEGRAFYSPRSYLTYQVLEVVSSGLLVVQDLRTKDIVERRTRESLDHKEMSKGAYRDARKKRRSKTGMGGGHHLQNPPYMLSSIPFPPEH